MNNKIKIPKIKSPLRYPGGKSRALKQILPIVPEFKEFREPFVGGGSVFFALKQLFPDKKFHIPFSWMMQFIEKYERSYFIRINFTGGF